MNVLVVGGAGYVGSHALRALTTAGHRAFAYDDLSTGQAAAVRRATGVAGRLIEGSLHDAPRLAEALRDTQAEAVFHFAAFSLVGESTIDPARYWRNNVGGSLALFDAMRASQARRIVFSSTASVYGTPERSPIPEDAPLRPISPYGTSKTAVEHALSDYAAAYGFAAAALRYFNAAGADPAGDLGEDHRPETHLIPLALDVALGQRADVTIYGADFPTPDGTCQRDFVHVSDLADAHVQCLERLEPGRVWRLNLGTGRAHSVREVIDACRRVTGHPLPVKEGPRRSGDAARLEADSSAARRRLGWRPRYVELDAIVESAWRWRRAHPHGYPDEAV